MRTIKISRPRTDQGHIADERRTYTVTEVADIVGISRSTAYGCVRRGEIPSRRFGRRIVVLRHELERLLTTSTLAGPTPSESALAEVTPRRARAS